MTTTTDIGKITAKIKALLAKANDATVTEAEAELFNAKAHELMAKYNVARGELDDKSGPVERTAITLKVQLRPWSSYVLAGITKLYYCTYFSKKLDAKGRNHEVTIIGEVQNAAVAQAIAVMVLRSITAAARQHGDGRSFMTGAGYEVHRRCHEMYTAVHSVLPPTSPQGEAVRLQHNREANALVAVAQDEAMGNEEYIRVKMGIELRKRKSSGPKVTSSSAFDRGTAHGSTVQLRRNLLGSN